MLAMLVAIAAVLALVPAASARVPRVWLVGDSITNLYANGSFTRAVAEAGLDWQVGEYGRPYEATKAGLCRSYLLLHRDDLFNQPRADLFGTFWGVPVSCAGGGLNGTYQYPQGEPPIPPADEPPDVVVALFGANDINTALALAKPGPCPVPDCGAAEIAYRMVALGDTFRASGAAVIIGTPLMSSQRPDFENLDLASCHSGSPPPSQEQVDACLAAYRFRVEQYWYSSRGLRREIKRQWRGREINFLAPNLTYMSDYVHPSVPQGTDWLAQRVMRVVRSELRRGNIP